jgi:hypothetical protein
VGRTQRKHDLISSQRTTFLIDGQNLRVLEEFEIKLNLSPCISERVLTSKLLYIKGVLNLPQTISHSKYRILGSDQLHTLSVRIL